jgi:hypothetical protein
MQDLEVTLSGGSITAGEAYLTDTALLRPHAGTQPDLLLRWNEIPLAAASVDVVVHLHGFSQRGRAMPLAEKAASSGLDLSRRTRPTLALLPRGNWLRYTWYDFPALLEGGMDRLVDYGLERLAEAAGQGTVGADRLVLTAHSGGGMPAVDVIAGGTQPDELYVFDGLYGRDPSLGDPMRGLETIGGWLGERVAQEPARAGALRVIYIEQQTGPFSREVGKLIARRLANLDPELAALLRRRYRVEPSLVQHSQIARRCLPELLAASDAEFDWSR